MKLRTWKRLAARDIAGCRKFLRRRRDWHRRYDGDLEPLYADVERALGVLKTPRGRSDFIEARIYNGYLPEMPGRPQDREAARKFVYGDQP
jgi:hypothetical protein